MTRLNMVRHSGGSRIISVNKVIPPDWIALEMRVIKSSRDKIVVEFQRVR